MVLKQESHIARKTYLCDASIAIFNQCSLSDFTNEEYDILKKSQDNGCKILPGTCYVYVVCTYPDFGVFRAIPEVLNIYNKYKLYEE